LCLIFITLGKFCSAQMAHPVKWAFTAKKIDGSRYEIHLTAALEKGWHIYSQNTPDDGPIPTSIHFKKNPLLTLQGRAKEMGKLEQHLEPLFGVEVKQFSNKVEWVQVVQLKKKVKTNLAGTVEFMVCNNQECLPPSSVPFSVALK
jgi:DsbC/DsbD-like thiol-disulfide interchange protein